MVRNSVNFNWRLEHVSKIRNTFLIKREDTNLLLNCFWWNLKWSKNCYIESKLIQILLSVFLFENFSEREEIRLHWRKDTVSDQEKLRKRMFKDCFKSVNNFGTGCSVRREQLWGRFFIAISCMYYIFGMTIPYLKLSSLTSYT